MTENLENWACEACTFLNEFDCTVCEICGTARPAGIGQGAAPPENNEE